MVVYVANTTRDSIRFDQTQRETGATKKANWGKAYLAFVALQSCLIYRCYSYIAAGSNQRSRAIVAGRD